MNEETEIEDDIEVSYPPCDEVPPADPNEVPAALRSPDDPRAGLIPPPRPTERPQGALMLALGKLEPSPTNPRKTFRGLEELAESIKAVGILQPIVVRPRGTNGSSYFELVFGERRRRAAGLAGLEEVPCLVREMTDDQVLEVQIIENVQREDVDALEEADGYRLLHEKRGYSVHAIADKIGKSIAYVYARLKLCALGSDARKALADGKLTDSTALLVARIPLPLQKEAVKELEPRAHWSEEEGKELEVTDPIGAREAFARVQRRFMLRLADAPFDPKDAELLPAAGACVTCPKRTGSQPELFPDVKAADTCTDPDCFAAKRDAIWEKRKAEAKAAGIQVVEGKKAKQYFPYGTSLAHASGMVDLDAQDWSDAKRRTFREKLGKKLEEAGPVTLVRTEDGKVHELLAAKDVKKLQPKQRVEAADERKNRTEPSSPAAKMKVEAERAAGLIVLGLVVKKFEAKEPDKVIWRLLVEREIDCAACDVDAVLERRGLGKAATKAAEKTYLDKLDVAQLRGLFIEIAFSYDAEFFVDRRPLARTANAMKIDVKQIVAKEIARLKTEAKAAKSPISAEAISKMPARDEKAVLKAKKSLKSKLPPALTIREALKARKKGAKK